MTRRLRLGALWLATTLAVASCRDAAAPPSTTLLQQVRASVAADDIPAGEARLAEARARTGLTPEWLEAQSWIGRGHLAASRLDQAERHARETYTLASELLKTRPMDAEPKLPLAYGAAVETLAQVEARRGARSEALVFLERERVLRAGTSITMRLQKNINLLSLEGTQAPALAIAEFLGPPPSSLAALRGKVVLLFFWAHWCSDCKQMAPVLARLDKAYRDQGLVIVAPTQRYGYVAAGAEATAEVEADYIDSVRLQAYSALGDAAVPLDAANHQRYGVSSTPTVVLVDRAGVIRLYHPGRMAWEAIEPQVRALVAQPTPSN